MKDMMVNTADDDGDGDDDDDDVNNYSYVFYSKPFFSREWDKETDVG